MTPSPCSSPCTNSTSAPGVRMVVVNGSPPIRISSGSSPATVSGRVLNAPSRYRTTGVRTVTRLTRSACHLRPARLVSALAADHPDLQDPLGVGALGTVGDEVVMHVEGGRPRIVPVGPQ